MRDCSSGNLKIKQCLLGESEGRWVTRRQGGDWGTNARDGVRTGVRERLPSKEGFVSMLHKSIYMHLCGRLHMINRKFVCLLMGVFSRVCSGVLWEKRESTVSYLSL